jgi:hypothetical protein
MGLPNLAVLKSRATKPACALKRQKTSERELQRTIDFAIKGIIGEAEAHERLPVLRAERAELEAELATIPEPPKVMMLKPALVVGASGPGGAGKRPAGRRGKTCIRDLVTAAMVYPPRDEDAPHIRIEGYLSSMVADEPLLKVRGGPVVAEEGFEPPT